MHVTKYQEEIIAHFGYWPVFSDASVLSFKSNSDKVILFVKYIDSNKSLQAKIKLSFSGVSDNKLGGFVPNSVIDSLKILTSSKHWVAIEPCFGIGGSFKCTSIEATIINI